MKILLLLLFFIVSVNLFNFYARSLEKVDSVCETVGISIYNPLDTSLDYKLGTFQTWRGCYI